jgi:hypothetical protein
MSFVSILKKGAKKIGKGVSDKATQIYKERQEEKDIYKEEYRKEKLKQIRKEAKEKARNKSNKLNKFQVEKKEYF